MKKLICLIVAVCMILSLCATVLAAEPAADTESAAMETVEGESAEGESAEGESADAAAEGESGGDAGAPAEGESADAAAEGESTDATAEGESGGDAGAPAEGESADATAEGESGGDAGAPAEGESADATAEGESGGDAGAPAEGESTDAAAEGGESAATEGGDSAAAAGGGDSAAQEAGPTIVDLVPEEMDELIIGPEGYTFTTDVITKKLEIDPAAEITSQYPVVVTFEESDSVENGTIIDNVQFVSDYDEVIAIVHTNDVHGHIDVEPYVKGLADELKASGEYSLVLTVSAGDVYAGGEAVAGSYKGEFIPSIIDKIYDVIVPGNNDVGPIGIQQEMFLTALYDNTVTLCANLEADEGGIPMGDYAAAYETKIGDELFDELYDKVTVDADGNLDLSALGLVNLDPQAPTHQHTAMVETDKGTKIGLFGLTTSIASGGDNDVKLPYINMLSSTENAQTSIDELKEEGADIVIGVGHTGWTGVDSMEVSSNDTNSWQLAVNTTGMDVLIDGHTHSIINDGQGVLAGEDYTMINQAQCFGDCIGVMYLYVKDGEVIAIDANVLTDMEGIQPDAEIQALVDQAMAKVKEDFGKPIAYTEYFLNGERLSSGNEGGSIRGNETNLGDLFTDVLLAASEEKTGLDFDFIAYPGFLLRASVEPGDITLETIQSVLASGGFLYYQDYTGQDIVDMVTDSVSMLYPDLEGVPFMHYSGITVTYTYDAGVGTPVTIMVGDTLVYDANNGGLQVDESWTCSGVQNGMEEDKDQYENFVTEELSETQEMVGNWFQTHTADDYTVYPNTVAPAGRIVPAE